MICYDISLKGKLQNKRIAFFDPGCGFATNPSLMYIADQLILNGSHLEIYYRSCRSLPQIGENIIRYPFPQKVNFCLEDIKETLRSLKWYIKTAAWKGKSILKTKQYDLVFGINSNGIIAADNYARENNIPVVYLSYEIYFKDELTKKWEFREKEEEIVASRNARIVVIQDTERAKLIKKENHLLESQFVYLPVSPHPTNNLQKSNYLREAFNIPKSKRIVLHSGSFEEWNCANEIIDSIPYLPENVVLVIHTRSIPKKNDKVMALLREQKDNLILSTTPFENVTYEKMISSADIGISFYKQTPPDRFLQRNIKHIGLSSGKFASYVKHGLPVITLSDQRIYREMFSEYSFGKSISSFNQLPDAINSIISNYSFHRKEAKRLFTEKLDPNIYWPNLFQKICELIS